MNNNEARRCLLCKKPKCSITGCPVHTPVPECMELYKEDRLDEAGKLLFDNNPLSAITSRVCDWRQFCFGNCVLNVKKMPVRWYEIEKEISARYLPWVKLERESDELAGKTVAIVGTGPVGIAATVWLYRMGAEITLYDSNRHIGGVLRYGIPTFRLDPILVEAYERLILGAGIEFRSKVKIGSDLSLATLSEDYDIVLIGAGADKPSRLGIPGEDSPMVLEALPFLKEPGAFNLGKKVIVIGGGNVAMDVSRTAVRHGAETWIYYRKTYENMPANPFEVEEAQREGVNIAVFQAPVEVREGEVVFRDCENFRNPYSGRLETRIIEGTEHVVECDTLIPAISEKPDFHVVAGLRPVRDEKGWVAVGQDGLVSFEDNLYNNIYAAGDFVLGPSTIVQAVASTKVAVNAIKERFSR